MCKKSSFKAGGDMMIREISTKVAILIIFIILVLQARYCHVPSTSKFIVANDSSKTGVMSNLEKIRKRGRIVALTDNSSTSYFVYKGEPMGYEYELLSLFAKHLGVDLEIKIARNMNAILNQLNRGEADIVAANLTVTSERSEIVSFTHPLLLTRQMLIQRLPSNYKRLSPTRLEKNLVRSPEELIGKEVFVRKNSSFYQRLKNLSEETGGEIIIAEAPGNYETEELISLVAKGEIDFTVADENVALVNQTYYPNIDVKTPLSLPQKIAWAVGKDSEDLLDELNDWIDCNEQQPIFALLFNKYFVNRKAAEFRNESPYFSKTGGNISIYDHVIKTYSKKIGWDWRLLASLIYQESRFDPEAHSWAGADGLMQLIPSTSARYGIDSLTATPVQSIEAGTKYLMSIDRYWRNYITDSNERVKFVLASYNVGLGHIIDARSLALKYHYNPSKWSNNVEWCLLQKSKPKYYNDLVVKFGYCRGKEPCAYVKQILSRYRHYKNVIDEKPYAADFSRAEI